MKHFIATIFVVTSFATAARALETQEADAQDAATQNSEPALPSAESSTEPLAATASAQPATPESDSSAGQAFPASQASAATEESREVPNRWLLLCCGLPGDQPHRERLTGACENIITASHRVLGVPPDQLQVLVGDDEMRDALSDQALEVGVCNSESVANALQQLSEKVQPEDSVWVMLLGHAHLYNGRSQFNVLDADFDQKQFSQWAEPIKCNEQVFWLTMPVSGFWIKPLAAPSRVVISATEADLEFTGTEMPYALADVLAGEGQDQSLEDVDQDGSLSLLDLYLATNLEVADRFRSIDRLQTEHGQLEDNGDGRGSELQERYLPVDDEDEDLEENDPEENDAEDDDSEESEESTESQASTERKPKVPDPISSKSLDGFRSRHIFLKSPDA